MHNTDHLVCQHGRRDRTARTGRGPHRGQQSATSCQWAVGQHRRGRRQANFDRSHALLVSGRGEGVTSNFVPTVDIIADELRADGVSVSNSTVIYVTDPHAQFVGRTPDRDVIFYRDHGNEDEWSGVLSTSQVLGLDFGNTRPVAFAAACLAGNYEDTDDVNLPDAFMNKGVGAYIASTGISDRPHNDFASKYFFRHWPTDQCAGVALTTPASRCGTMTARHLRQWQVVGV